MPSFKVVKLTEDLVAGAVDVLRHSFFTDEKICNCVNILQDSPQTANDSRHKCTKGSLELESLAVDTVKDNVSLVAVKIADETNVVGVAFNKIQVKPPPGRLSYFEQFAVDHIKDESALGLVKFMVDADAKKDLFEHFNTECSFEIMFLAVRPACKGQGIGRALVEESIREAREYWGVPKPTIVTALCTSRFSLKAFIRAGTEAVHEVPYTEFSYKGRKFSEVTGPEHPSCVVVAAVLNKSK